MIARREEVAKQVLEKQRQLSMLKQKILKARKYEYKKEESKSVVEVGNVDDDLVRMWQERDDDEGDASHDQQRNAGLTVEKAENILSRSHDPFKADFN